VLLDVLDLVYFFAEVVSTEPALDVYVFYEDFVEFLFA